MNGPGHRFLTTSALIGMMAVGGWGAATLSASPAVAATGTPRAPRTSRRATAKPPGGAATSSAVCTRPGAIEGSQATIVTHHKSVLVGLPGYNPSRTSSDTTSSNKPSAPNGLLPAMTTYGYPSWTSLGSARNTPGAIAPVRKGSIEGSQATIVVHHKSVLVGLPGYNPSRTSSDTTSSNKPSAPNGLLPAMTTYGYPSWTSGTGTPAGCTPAT